MIWARSQIADMMRLINTSLHLRTVATNDTELKNKVTDLGLNFALTTQWTSFVAVSEKIVNAHPEQTEHSNVPLPMVKGVTEKAYGDAQPAAAAPTVASAQPQNFSGGAAPAPSTVAGLIIVSLMGAWTVYRRRQLEQAHV